MITISMSASTVKEPTATECRTAEDVAQALHPYANLAQEAFYVLTLNVRNHIIDSHLVTLGVADACLVHPREVFRPAISDGAASVIVAHNHPSGDPSPSSNDLRITKQLIDAGEIIGIEVMDHVILGRGQHLSLRESGLCQFGA